MQLFNAYYSTRDAGLLILRLGVGFMMMAHGWPKITGGPEGWAELGGSMQNLGIGFAPTFWGFMAAFGEFGGGLLFAFGFLFLPGTVLLAVTMLVASIFHLTKGDGLMGASHAIELLFVFLGLAFVGPGRFSVDAALMRPRIGGLRDGTY